MDGDRSLKLGDKEIASTFADPLWAERFPPVMTLDQAAALLQVPKATLYDWRSRGLLGACSRKIGKHVRVFRDRLIRLVFNEGLSDET
jgi:excisionase family DNA binding protein